jgi:hypothetical protein
MQDAVPHQHAARAAATAAPSLLRLSIAQRLLIAALFASALWLAVGWALDWLA